ncbi:MAG: heavy-metal-associated domain-containing protein [Candidatus Marinimicrobia bacterium]|nr:heavy-metal-associated domain-containing protein [Candidatus Neomarinimicrobiota bacterium]
MNTKRIIGFALIAFLIVGIVACGGKEKTDDTGKSQPQMMMGHGENQTHAMVKLPTVQCGMCKSTIETGLGKMDGIVSVNVDIEDKMGHINYNPAQLNLKQIEKAISDLGYQANETPANLDAYAKLPMCCKLPENRQ